MVLPTATRPLAALIAWCVFASTLIAAAESPTEAELGRNLDEARRLAEAGEHEAAMQAYLDVFDNSRGTSFTGVRLSYVLSELAALGEKHPPARQALIDRRDQRRERILAGNAGFTEIHEFTAFNEYLGDKQDNLAVHDALKAEGPARTESLKTLRHLISEQLVEAGRFEDVGEEIIELSRGVARHIAEYEIEKDFPRPEQPTGGPDYLHYLRNSIIEDGTRTYEVLLEIKDHEQAERLAGWMLRFEDDAAMYERLIETAIGAEALDHAARLLEEAGDTLPEAELEQLDPLRQKLEL